MSSYSRSTELAVARGELDLGANLVKGEADVIEPRTAPEVGVRAWHEWPYGPNICAESRVAMRSWAARHGLRLARQPKCGHWLTRRQCHERDCSHLPDFEPSWLDHVTGWCRNGKRAVLVSQPYPKPESHAEAVQAFAEQHGLQWLVDPGGGWYFHGTTFVVLWRADRVIGQEGEASGTARTGDCAASTGADVSAGRRPVRA